MALIQCDICGYSYDPLELETVRLHNLKHASIHDLELPSHIRDCMRRWAEETIHTYGLQAISDRESQSYELVKSAIELMMHMWWNEEYTRFTSKEEAFESYRKEIRKRYPIVRGLYDSIT